MKRSPPTSVTYTASITDIEAHHYSVSHDSIGQAGGRDDASASGDSDPAGDRFSRTERSVSGVVSVSTEATTAFRAGAVR